LVVASEYFFGVTHGIRIPDETGKRLDTIAKEHGARFTWTKPPDGYRAWFSCDSRGEPFDRAVAAAVHKAVEDAGIKYRGFATKR
jgi:hypothetical protein